MISLQTNYVDYTRTGKLRGMWPIITTAGLDPVSILVQVIEFY
jgi:hypothetical protein